MDPRKFIQSLALLDGGYNESQRWDLKQLLHWKTPAASVVCVDAYYKRISDETFPIWSLTALIQLLLTTDYRKHVVCVTLKGEQCHVTSKHSAKMCVTFITNYIRRLYEANTLETVDIGAVTISKKAKRQLGDHAVNQYTLWLKQIHPIVVEYVMAKQNVLSIHMTIWELMDGLHRRILDGHEFIDDLTKEMKNFIESIVSDHHETIWSILT